MRAAPRRARGEDRQHQLLSRSYVLASFAADGRLVGLGIGLF
ncbi:hypothetical protein [Halarchaeum acidiphilum]|nr:hypothetical protein [Halarchaeum acidiphilum]